MSEKKRAAVFTIAQNEPVFLPIWANYYSKHFDASDIYILDHQSTDRTTINTARKYNHIRVYRNESFNHKWLKTTVESFQGFLLQSYEYVLFAETDEILFPNPEINALSLGDYIKDNKKNMVGSKGFELVHLKDEESGIDLKKEILKQRRFIRKSNTYSKVLLSNTPLIWIEGFHKVIIPKEQNNINKDLILLHLHRMDFDIAWDKCIDTASRKWNKENLESGGGFQNRITDLNEFKNWFYNDFYDGLPFNPEIVPSNWIGVI